MSRRGRSWREIQEKIRRVLDSVWDPIGVADEVEGEYDAYIGPIYTLLREGADDDRIAARLLELETTTMGLPGSPVEHRQQVVAALRALELPELRRER